MADCKRGSAKTPETAWNIVIANDDDVERSEELNILTLNGMFHNLEVLNSLLRRLAASEETGKMQTGLECFARKPRLHAIFSRTRSVVVVYSDVVGGQMVARAGEWQEGWDAGRGGNARERSANWCRQSEQTSCSAARLTDA